MSPKAISLKTLPMDELAGVVNLYPWYGAARKELCRRMAGIGADSWGINQFADQAMYVGDRGLIADIMRSGNAKDYSDKNLEELVRSYIIEDNKPVANVNDNVAELKPQPARRIPGGDFFSQSEYENVRREDDNVFSRFRANTKPAENGSEDNSEIDFCTETLAGIYAEQGYFDQAKRIYSKLILAFPEKSAYFASLIKKIDYLINNQTL